MNKICNFFLASAHLNSLGSEEVNWRSAVLDGVGVLGAEHESRVLGVLQRHLSTHLLLQVVVDNLKGPELRIATGRDIFIEKVSI